MLATASRREVAPPLIPPYDAFLRRGNLLPSRNERSGLKRSDGSERSEAKVKGGDTALPCRQSVANFKFAFLGCGSRRLKFTNLTSNLNVKR